MTGFPDNIGYTPLKYVCHVNAATLPDDSPEDLEIEYIDISAVNELGAISTPETMIFSKAPSRARRIVRSGDVLISTVRTYLKAIAHIPHAGENLICSTGFAVLSAGSGVVPRFLYYWVSSDAFVGEIVSRSVGVSYPAINPSELMGLPFPRSTAATQATIADFLDIELSRIDDLISKKQRLIELLGERRSAFIGRAVTQGLDLGVPMKDSAVEALGTIPRHWSVRRVGSLATIVRGASPRPAGDPQYFNGDCTPWITVGELTKDNKKYLDATETFLTAEGAKLSRVVQKGTLLLSNSGATLGIPKITRVSGCINDGSVAFLRLTSEMDQEFLYYVLAASTKDLRERLKQGAGQPNLNTALVRAMNVPLPPIHEQRRIVDVLDNDFERTTAMQGTTLATIDRLREYRSALITAAVTGQLDMRANEKKLEVLA